MGFMYDSTGISLERGGSFLKPKGWYEFEILSVQEKKTKNGDPMVSVKCAYADDKGQWLYHSVTFLPQKSKGAGMQVHFRKSIGVPWEGNVEVEPDEWIGKKFMGFVTVGEYLGKKRNEIKEIKSVDDVKGDDSIPF